MISTAVSYTHLGVSLNSVQLAVYLAVGDDDIIVFLQTGNVRVAGILVQLGVAGELGRICRSCLVGNIYVCLLYTSFSS